MIRGSLDRAADAVADAAADAAAEAPLERARRIAAAAAAGDGSIALPPGWKLVRSAYAAGRWDGRLERHRRFVDFHAVARGRELVAVEAVEGLAPQGAYDEANDVAFLHGNAPAMVELGPGDWLALGTAEAHMPKIAPGRPAEAEAEVEKIVIKIPVEAFGETGVRTDALAGRSLSCYLGRTT